MCPWHSSYKWPITPATEPLSWHDDEFDQLLIRTSVFDEMDRYLKNIQAQRGKFWVSSPSGGYGKSTMLQYVARMLYSKIDKWNTLPFLISVGKKTPTVEHTFFRGFIDQFLKLPKNLLRANGIFKFALSAEIKSYVFEDFRKYSKSIKDLEEELPSLSVVELEKKFLDVLEKVLQHWTKKQAFSKYVLLVDEMDKLHTDEVLSFLSGNQDLFQRLYKDYGFVAFLSGHRSWVEMIHEGTEYNYYRGVIFRIPAFVDVSDVKELVDARLTQEIYMRPADNPWTTEGYQMLRTLTDGVPRIMIGLAAEATNEAQRRDLSRIGPGVVEEVLYKAQYALSVEAFLKGNYETYLKLREALDKHIDSLLYIFYDSPGHQITKAWDRNFQRRVKSLGLELNDDEWSAQIQMLVQLECLSEGDTTRMLSKDIRDLFDKLRDHPALIKKIVPGFIKRLGDLEPRARGPLTPPDYQEIINTNLRASGSGWITKREIFDKFLFSTQFRQYLLLLQRRRSVNPDDFSRSIFDSEFKKYVNSPKHQVMEFNEGNKLYYRLLPKGMLETDYLVLRKLGHRELLDGFIDLIVDPLRHDLDVERRMDQLIESTLHVLAETKEIRLEPGCLHRKNRIRVFKELGLDDSLRRRLVFYAMESKAGQKDREMIRNISRQIILDLAEQHERIIMHLARTRTQIRKRIKGGENQTTEFKSSMCWSYEDDKRDNAVEFAIAKTISAFMNTDGGTLLIGIGDNGQTLGLEKDFAAIKKPSKDGFELHFTGLIAKHLGNKYRPYAKVRFVTLDGKTVAVVEVKKSPVEVFVKWEGKTEFYIRAGNSSQPLNVEEASEYIKAHWLRTPNQ